MLIHESLLCTVAILFVLSYIACFARKWGINKLNEPSGKNVFGVYEQVQHKPGCTATEDGLRLEISDLERRGMVLSK